MVGPDTQRSDQQFCGVSEHGSDVRFVEYHSLRTESFEYQGFDLDGAVLAGFAFFGVGQEPG